MAATAQIVVACPGCGDGVIVPLQISTQEKTEQSLVANVQVSSNASAVIDRHMRQMHRRMLGLA